MRIGLPSRERIAEAFKTSRIVGLSLLGLVLAIQVVLGDSEDVPWRHDWWDRLHNISPRDRGDPADSPVVIVAIDGNTMDVNGQWPWPREKLALLVHQISAFEPAVIAFDIIFSKADDRSPKAIARDYRAFGRIEAAEALEQLRDSDEDFAAILREGARDENGNMLVRASPVVLPVLGIPDFTDEVKGQGCDFPQPAVGAPPEGLALSTKINAADPPLEQFTQRRFGLQEAALAAINFTPPRDFIVRRFDVAQQICDKTLLSLGAEATRVREEAHLATVRTTFSGLRVFLGPPDAPDTLSFPTEHDGTFWLHFGGLGTPEEVSRRYIEAHSLFDPDPAAVQRNFDALRDKVVLLAVIDLGFIDERKSPLGETIWGIEAHAQTVEQIVSQNFLRRPWFLFHVETIILGLLSILVILAVPRAPPARSLLLLPLGTVGLLFLSWVAFTSGLLIDLASPALGVTIVGGGVIGLTLIERDRERLKSQIALESERADRSFLQGELDAAARIQMELLPPKRFQRAEQVDLACFIDPARTVGGDFYDHCLVDERHLFFLVADVSGKGADASQFMLLSKTLWKSTALRLGPPLDRIQLQANSEITRENTATMFVTALCGVLDLETGRLLYSSAGHDSPYLFGEGKTPKQLDDFSGPPAGLVEGMDYPVGEVTLQPGDRLCVFTDGVTEAMDTEGTLFGLERLEAALGTAQPGLDSAGLVDHVVDRVRRFTKSAEQSDDLTLMVISIPE